MKQCNPRNLCLGFPKSQQQFSLAPQECLAGTKHLCCFLRLYSMNYFTPQKALQVWSNNLSSAPIIICQITPGFTLLLEMNQLFKWKGGSIILLRVIVNIPLMQSLLCVRDYQYHAWEKGRRVCVCASVHTGAYELSYTCNSIWISMNLMQRFSGREEGNSVPQGNLATTGDIFGCHIGGCNWHLVSGGRGCY